MGAGPWTSHEDLILKTEYARLSESGASNVRWDAIARVLPGRSNRDVRKRWVNVLQRSHNKGTWTVDEDERLRAAIQQFNTRWVTVAEAVQTRSADQCSKRWNQHLNPHLLHVQWTTEESILLFKAIGAHGNNWSVIRKLHFPRRPSNSIKNQHTIISRNEERLQGILAVVVRLPPCCNQIQPYHMDDTLNSTSPDHTWQPPDWTQDYTQTMYSYIPKSSHNQPYASTETTRTVAMTPTSHQSSHGSEASFHLSSHNSSTATPTWTASSDPATKQRHPPDVNMSCHGILVPQTRMSRRAVTIFNEPLRYSTRSYDSVSPTSYSSPTAVSPMSATASSVSDMAYYTQNTYDVSMADVTSAPIIQHYGQYAMYGNPPPHGGTL